MKIIFKGLAKINIENNMPNIFYQYYNDLSICDEEIIVADTLDFENHTVVRNIAIAVFEGNEDWRYDIKTKSYYLKIDLKFCDEISGFCDKINCTYFIWQHYKEPLDLYKISNDQNKHIYFNYDNGEKGVEVFKKWLKSNYESQNPMETYFILQNPYISNFEAYNPAPRFKPYNIEILTKIQPSKVNEMREIEVKAKYN